LEESKIVAKINSFSGYDVMEYESSWEGKSAMSKLITPGDLAPDFELEDVRGKHIRLSDFRGKPVVLAFLRGFM
jgi:cytochrome oxidase Cu insertion factor (SCO1/SenC/PrrC family)